MLKLSQLHKMNLTEYAALVKNELPRHHYFAPDKQTVVHQCLSLINFKKLETNSPSIEQHAKRVLDTFLSPDFKSIYDDDPIGKYFRIILDLAVLPIYHKHQLEGTIKKDLAIVGEILEKYHRNPFIKDYLNGKRNPKNHRERTTLEFYKRTCEKKEVIFDHLLNKCEERAIIKSKAKSTSEDMVKMDEIMSRFDSHFDFPYRDIILDSKGPRFEVDIEKLDSEKINPLRNKPILFGLEGLSSSNISKEMDKRIDGLKILKSLSTQLKKLPIRNRNKIFRELRKLYENGQWYGFYALGLPQVEGIFSEMVEIANPKKGQMSSLSDKVNAIRPFIESSSYSFDYYEYFLPNQRNQFAHTGNDTEIELKCKYLVLDLEDVISQFEELQSPLIQLNHMLNDGLDRFKHIGNYSRLLFLVEQVALAKQMTRIKSKLDLFVYKNLVERIDFDQLIQNLQVDFESAKNSVQPMLKFYLKTYLGKEFDVFLLPKDEISTKVDDVATVIEEHGVLFREDLKLLLDTHNFIRSFPKQFPEIKKELTEKIIDFDTANADILDRLQIINAKRKIVSDEDFIIRRGEWRHEKFL